MPAPETRPSRTVLTVLFWIGVGLAPVAALILLVADGNGPLRFAAVLAILAVVLIGLSIALRADGEGGQARVEEVLDEMEQLRRELRGEIVAAAQRGNQALDQAQRAQEAVAAIRRRLDATGAALVGAAEEPAGAGRARVPAAEVDEDVPPGRGRAAAREDDAPRWGRDDRDDEPVPGRGPAHGDRPAAGRHGAERPPAGTYGDRAGSGVYGGDRPPAGTYGDRAGSGVYGGDRPPAAQPGVYGARPGDHDREPAPRPIGLVRHTETVHVTTRHTIVDGAPAEPTGGRYGGYAGGWSPPAEERPWAGADDRWAGPEERPWPGHAGPDERPWPGHAGPDERPWPGHAGPEERPRHGDDRPWAGSDAPRDEPGWDAPRDERPWTGRRDEPAWSSPDDQRGWPDHGGGPGDRGWADPAEPARSGPAARPDDTGEYWTQMRAGDRWAAVRDDDRGREVRMGERRAEVHADATGAEYRVADRWASVRHDEPPREDSRWGEPPRDEPRWGAGRPAYGRGDEGRRDGWAEPEDRPALPSGGVPVPDEWRPPRQRDHRSADAEPEWVGRRPRADEERHGYPPQEAPRGGARWR